ncbi:MAG: M1 family metallopeptidase [Thermoplasmata archaeon]|nr:M1 family metallopeptidase [Thermoplasmata archaeon]
MEVAEYALHLDVDYPRERFSGDLRVVTQDPPAELTLDCEGLSVARVWAGEKAASFDHDPTRHELRIRHDRSGAVEFRIQYTGAVGQKTLSGLYASRDAGRTYLTTMMEPVGCRRLLPCLDRPDQKAVFRLSVTTERGLTVISNTPVATVEEQEERTCWRFEPTPRMSTYLLYLGIGPFELLARTENGIEFVAATGPGKSAQAATSLDLSVPLLKGYESYFGLPYPLPKLHLVAVPDLGAGAMENWGAIAFSEIGLLLDPATSPSVRRWAVETIAHEIAHQWFGNLVTMRSFTDIWLNESFATFVAAKMVDRLHLREDPWSEFLIRIRNSYFTDSLASTHPIQLESAAPDDIMQNVDEITYFKGAAVLRMIDAYLGEEAFRRGVSTYLARYQYGNAEGPDLWRAMEEASNEPVGRVMRTWVERPGLPVIRASLQDGRLLLRQERFRLTPQEAPEPPWPIPLTALIDGRLERRLFDDRELELPLEHPESLQLNPGRAGFLRVWYDLPLRASYLRRLSDVAPFDRWAFLSDAFAFLLAGEYRLEDYLGALRALEGVGDYPSVMEAVITLDSLHAILGNDPRYLEAADRFSRAQLARLGLEPRQGEPESDAMLRESVTQLRVRADSAFAAELAQRFDAIDRSDAALRPAIALAYARVGAPEALERLYARLEDTTSEDSASQAATAMGEFQDPVRLSSALERSLAPARRVTLSLEVIGSVVENPVGAEIAWPWVRSNLDEVRRRAEGSWYLARLFQRILPRLGLAHPTAVRAHFREVSYPEASTGVRRGIELLGVLELARARLLPRAPPP